MTAFTHKLDQVTYPKMERQDLTQSQLGSFKFTPTDEVRPVFTRTSPRLAQQFIHSLNHNSRVDLPVPTTTSAVGDSGHSTYHPSDPTLSPTRFNSTLFDTYFKQDLAKSRLQLGPNALRAAVDGSSTSPQRTSADRKGFVFASAADSMSHEQMPVQNGPSAYCNSSENTMPVNVATSIEAPFNNNFFQTSLVRALATEQEAHQVTKDALKAEKALRMEAEALAQRYHEHNRSLLGSVNMLKSVVQHNMKREQETAADHDHEPSYQKPSTDDQPATLLHDAVKNLRRPVPKVPSQLAIDHSQLYDFKLVDAHGSPALQRQFSITLKESSAAATTGSVIEDDTGDTKNHYRASRHEKSDESWETGDMTIGARSDDTGFVEISPVSDPEAEASAKAVALIPTKIMAMPFDPHVKWSQDPIFDDQGDKYNRLGSSASLFAKHPVRYFPKKSVNNIYRTVMMDFLPNGTMYRELLDNIRGGVVADIQLFGPIGQSTNFMTARVIFNYENGARTLYMRGQDPGIKIKGTSVRVWQVLEPTYPFSSELEDEIYEDGYTRYLLVQGASKAALDKLPSKLASQMKAGVIVEITESYDGIPVVEFTSTRECSKALKQLVSDPDFGGSRFDFEEDLCNCNY